MFAKQFVKWFVLRTEYELSYKAEKGTGAGTILEEEEEFEEFIGEILLIYNNKLFVSLLEKFRDIRDTESVSEDDESELTAKQKNK
ncbi:hypothetical protein GLOIN_2v1788104 [Rhizophagus irregularis DAOM 181602=DAOM 197198]|nr:hypothetical protein GLOIN_2v1788104 [Rhizophagus irregularis DAOM 181602=DAOM 197198]CAB5179832.1 unnamed protein product [Rhizophagus irregularis]